MKSRRKSAFWCKQKVLTKNKEEIKNSINNSRVQQGKKFRTFSLTHNVGVMLEWNLGNFCFPVSVMSIFYWSKSEKVSPNSFYKNGLTSHKKPTY